MNLRRLAFLPPMFLACLVLAGCSVSTGNASSRQSVAANTAPACEVEAVFDDAARLAREVTPLEADYLREGVCDATRLEALESDADDLRARLSVANPEPTHDASSKTLALALSQYTQGLAQLEDGLRNADAGSGAEGIQLMEQANDLRKDGLDQLLEEGRCD